MIVSEKFEFQYGECRLVGQTNDVMQNYGQINYWLRLQIKLSTTTHHDIHLMVIFQDTRVSHSLHCGLYWN